jgi:nucleoid DNA-binding protein|tara:strand:- start:198 stop:497 length:300 start_codon:yes stop_codon:yes gene_type:complete
MVSSKKSNLSKIDIIKNINKKLGLPVSIAKIILKDSISIITNGLIKDNFVKINNFGTFKVLFKKKRIGRNPKNKRLYEISERKTVSFKNADFLKNEINK